MVGTIGKVWALFHRPRARINVEPVLFLFMFATFLSYSTFQQLVHSLVCQQTSNCTLHQNATIIQPSNTTIQPSNTTIQPSNTTIQPSNTTSTTCREPPAVEQEVQNETSHWILFINLASGLPAILMSLFYGSLSDQLGRRIFIILPALGSGINAALVLVVIYLQYTLPITFFLVGAFLSGLLGTFAVINLAVYSYGSDISGHSSRTWQIGLLESMTYLGSTLSLIVGGLWIEKEGFAPPFWCVVACQLAIIIYTVVLLPESLGSRTNNTSVQQQERHGKTCPQLCQSVVKNVVSFISLLMGNWTMIALLITFFVVEINFLGITDTVILFALGDPLCWKSDLIGYFLALKVFLNGFATLFILPFLVYYGMSDTAIILVGMVAGAASLLLMGFANHTWIMFIGTLLSSEIFTKIVLCLWVYYYKTSH